MRVVVVLAVILGACGGEPAAPATSAAPPSSVAPPPSAPPPSAPPSSEAEAPTEAPAPTAEALRTADFAAYPAAPFTGETQLPDFDGAASDFATYRTRLTHGAREGANLAGHYRLEVIGCGTPCTDAYLVDLATGEVSELDGFPSEGIATLESRAESALLRTSVTAMEQTVHCHYENFVLADGTLTSLGAADDDGPCPE